ncbi:MAG: zinc-binding dehydrogenase [Candidatus Sericytochromatia bacterium]|nr:zinc-binding dehydrogenase [Candidatus Tanganyikabacteria bacterium]
MKAVAIDLFGRLRVEETPEPVVPPGHTLIRVRAAGVNFADCLARQGLYPDAPPRPFVPGYEVAGETPDGRRVMALTVFGGYSEVVAVPDSQVFPLPAGFSFEEGAGFLVTSLTAGLAMLGYGPLRAGDRVLIHAAAGGVGLAAVQIGLAHGAILFGTAGSETKCAFLAERGVQHPIDYRARDWAAAVREAGGELDLILDSLGGASVPAGLRLLAPRGRLVALGIAAGAGRGILGAVAAQLAGSLLPVHPLVAESRALIGLNMLRFVGRVEKLRDVSDALLALVRAGKLRPHVGATFPLGEARAAHDLLESRRSVGKVVLTTV